MEAILASTPSESAVDENKPPRRSRQARKRTANKKRKNGGKSAPEPAVVDEASKRQKIADNEAGALEYLREWNTDRDSWKFAKLKQRVGAHRFQLYYIKIDSGC